jgi:hypothetical protein
MSPASRQVSISEDDAIVRFRKAAQTFAGLIRKHVVAVCWHYANGIDLAYCIVTAGLWLSPVRIPHAGRK